jgi:transcriptional regulator with XRE-family HTH domain
MSVRQQLVSHLKKAPSLRSVESETGINVSVLSRIANGKRDPSGAVIERLADYFSLELKPAVKPATKLTTRRQ